MNRRTIQSVIFAALLVLGALACIGMAALRHHQPEPGLPQDVGGTGLYLRLYDQPEAPVVQLWQEPDTGHLYAFLPGWADADKILISSFDPAASFALDGQTMRGRGFVSLASGSHTLRLPGREQDVPLTVLRGSTGLPTLFLNLDAGSAEVLHSDKSIVETGWCQGVDSDGTLLFRDDMRIHGRGNTSWAGPGKSGYLLRTERRQDVFGMGEARKWVLVPNALDPTLLRNKIMYTLAEDAGMPGVVESRWTEVYLNGEYRGVYLLCEKIEIGPSRLDLHDLERQTEQLNPKLDLTTMERRLRGDWDVPGSGSYYDIPVDAPDVTGGYLMEADSVQRYPERPSGFVSERGQHIVLHSPVYLSAAQLNYVSAVYQYVENAAFSPDGIDPATGRSLAELADLDSFAAKYLAEEISKNLDGTNSSAYYYKPADSTSTLLYAGPLWDYDYALASPSDMVGAEAAAELRDPVGFRIKEDWELLYQMTRHPIFQEAVRRNFYEKWMPAVRKMLDSGIDGMTELLLPSMDMDLLRWNVWPEAQTPEQRRAAYLGEVDTVRSFLEQRTAWLAAQWPQ